MKTYMDQLVYEAYAQSHHRHLVDTARQARSLTSYSPVAAAPSVEPEIQPVLRYRLAYVIAVIFLLAVTVTQAAAAVMKMLGGGGGGLNLVR